MFLILGRCYSYFQSLPQGPLGYCEGAYQAERFAGFATGKLPNHPDNSKIVFVRLNSFALNLFPLCGGWKQNGHTSW